MTQSNEPNNQRINRQRINIQPSLGNLQLRVQLLGVDLEQPTLEELGELIREHRQENYQKRSHVSKTAKS